MHPTSLAILAVILLVSVALLFTYRGPHYILASVLILPMLTTIALGLLARPAKWVPSPTLFASICLVGSLIALMGGVYEYLVLDVCRPGLGNNPIHYASLAAMSGCLAMEGVVSGKAWWRYLFLLGPILGLGVRSRPLMVHCFPWHGRKHNGPGSKRERHYDRGGLVAVAVAYLVGGGNLRVAGIIQSGLDIFRFTGGPDDTRAALHASAIEIRRASPIVGVGVGQIMEAAETMFPNLLAGTGRENLHADWASFAAMAGALGLLAWLLCCCLRPYSCWSTAGRGRIGRSCGGAVLLANGQFILGARNATFGILPHTVIDAVGLGYLLARARVNLCSLRCGLDSERFRCCPRPIRSP